MAVNIEAITPVPNKHLPRDFKKAVALLMRPYRPITKAEHERIAALAADANTDVVLHRGKQVTFGQADGGYALMPLANPL